MNERKTAKREPQRRRAPGLGAGRAAIVIAVLVVLFFNAVVVGGKTFVSPDATAPAGFARIGEHALYHDHVYPLWNPYVFLGMPSFASGTYNPLIYPPDWPVAVLQKFLPLPELTWMLLYYFLAAFALFLLAREWGASPEGALLGGVAFVFAPNLVAVGSHGHGSQLVDSAYLPLMLWLATRWIRRGRLSDLAWLALGGGFQLLRGHVQICFYTWMAVMLYAACEWIGALRDRARVRSMTLRVAGVAVAAALALGLAGFYNLPLSDYARHSIRGTAEGGGVERSYATQWSLAPYELPSIVVPGWTGFGGETYWGGMPFTDYPNAYVGLVTVLLGAAAFLSGGVVRAFALALAVLALLVSFGRNFPLYGLLYDHLPLFNKFRVPVMIILLFQLAAALGLAWGWSAWTRRDSGPSNRGLDRIEIVAAVVLALGLIGAALAGGGGEAGYAAFATARRAAEGEAFPPQLATIAYHQFLSDLMKGCCLGLLALAIAWAARRGRLTATLATAGVLVVLLVELWPVSGRVMAPALGDPEQRNAELGRDDVVDFLAQQGDAGSFRILPAQEFQSNRFAGFAIASLGGYHAAKPRFVQDLIRKGVAQSPAWLRLLNVRYLVLSGPVSMPPEFALVHQGVGAVYEFHAALPRATVVGHYAVVQPDTAIIDSVATGSRDAAEWTYLSEDPHLQLGSTTGATARVTRYRLNDVDVDVDTPGAGLLRLADAWYPDWTVTVDGRPARLLRADYDLRAVAVPAGRHHVTFRFESPPIRAGLMLSLVSLAVILALFAAAAIVARRRTPAAVAAGAA